jgi:hypothetical protein
MIINEDYFSNPNFSIGFLIVGTILVFIFMLFWFDGVKWFNGKKDPLQKIVSRKTNPRNLKVVMLITSISYIILLLSFLITSRIIEGFWLFSFISSIILSIISAHYIVTKTNNVKKKN